VRSYTPISGDHQPGYFDLLIKSYPQGNISRHMASLAVGQSIRVKGPKGAFVYTPNMVRHFGMIAGGTGITPMLQVVKAIVRGRATAGDRTEVDLIFANVTEQDILLREDLDQLAREDKGFRVHYVLDKPPAGWEGGVGYVTAEMMQVCWKQVVLGEEKGVLTKVRHRNGCPRRPTTSRSCCAARRPWWAG
jgi:cytochrome-b5 reductase